MRNNRSVRHFLRCIAPACLAAGLIFAATQADAYYYGYGGYGGSYYGGRHGGYGGSHYGGYRRYGYRGGYYRGYRNSRYYGGYPYRRYSYGGAYDGYSYPQTRSPSYANTYNGKTNPAPSGKTNPAPQRNSDASRESGSRGGWARLAGGQYAAAISIFAAAATSEPKSGRPKVGYALSAAAYGDLRRGIWAMRRAIAIDPRSLHYVTVDESLRPRIEHLITRYQTDPDHTSSDADAAFMRASLHYLLGDAKSARGQADLAVAAGDRHPSTVNLERLIDKEIDAQPRHDVEGD